MLSEEEVQEVLDELNEVRPEVLNNEAKRLFEAIMKIADDRDKANKRVDELINEVTIKQCELEKKDKIIDLTTDWIKDNCYYQDDYGNSCSVIQDTCCDITKDCKKCIIEYFTKKVEEKEND